MEDLYYLAFKDLIHYSGLTYIFEFREPKANLQAIDQIGVSLIVDLIINKAVSYLKQAKRPSFSESFTVNSHYSFFRRKVAHAFDSRGKRV